MYKSYKVLENEHLLLSNKIRQLKDELSASRAYADEFVRVAHQKHEADWQKREAVYKDLIRELKQELRSNSSGVPLDLTKSVVEGAGLVRAKSDGRQEEIDGLTGKVETLEKRVKLRSQSDMTPIIEDDKHEAPTTARPIDRENEPNVRFKTPTNQPRPFNKVSFAFSKTPDQSGRGKVRMAMVRAAGGRKGLQDKLKLLRSPKGSHSEPFL